MHPALIVTTFAPKNRTPPAVNKAVAIRRWLAVVVRIQGRSQEPSTAPQQPRATVTSPFPTRQVLCWQDVYDGDSVHARYFGSAANRGWILIGSCASHMPSSSQCRNDVMVLQYVQFRHGLPKRAHEFLALLYYFPVSRIQVRRHQTEAYQFQIWTQQGSRALIL